MNSSAAYGLSNPAFTDDIGMTMINRQFPTQLDPVTGTIDGGNPGNIKINPGQPDKDTYSKSSEKKTPVWKKVLITTGILTGLSAIGYALFKKVPAVKNAITNIITKFKK